MVQNNIDNLIYNRTAQIASTHVMATKKVYKYLPKLKNYNFAVAQYNIVKNPTEFRHFLAESVAYYV